MKLCKYDKRRGILCGMPFLIYACIISLLFVSCNLEGENDAADYYHPTVSVVYSLEHLNVTFNGKSIDNQLTKQDSGQLSVYSEDSTTLLLDTTISIKSPIQLIQVSKKEVKVFHKEQFITFQTNQTLPKGYHVEFNNQTIVSGKNYLEKSKDNGIFKYYKDGQIEPVFTDTTNVTIKDNSIYLMIGDNSSLTTLDIPDSDTSDPESKEHSKLRFFYTPQVNDPDIIEVEFVAVSNEFRYIIDPYKSVVLEKGKLSSFIEFDNTIFSDKNDFPTFQCNVYRYDKSSNQRGELIQKRSSFRKITLRSSGYTTLYKFETYQIKGSNEKFRPTVIIREKW